jgi:polar amino acid transport system substrate-binding protein
LKFNIIILLLFLNALLSISSPAKAAEKIKVAFGEVLAPWVLSETNRGIIIDIFDSAMAPLGYEIDHVYLPYGRRTKAYSDGTVDVVSDMNANTIEAYALQGFMSDIAYSYENFAFSLHKRHYNFTHLNQLEKYSLLSWQDATVHMGTEYADMAKRNRNYRETFNQSNQVRMLFLDKFDVVQMDGHIFDYYRARIRKTTEIDTSKQVDRFPLFGASPNGFMFKSKKMRDEFNRQLKLLKTSGQYQKIINHYIALDADQGP